MKEGDPRTYAAPYTGARRRALAFLPHPDQEQSDHDENLSMPLKTNAADS